VIGAHLLHSEPVEGTPLKLEVHSAPPEYSAYHLLIIGLSKDGPVVYSTVPMGAIRFTTYDNEKHRGLAEAATRALQSDAVQAFEISYLLEKR
jgi:hypothetical protein